MLVEKIFRTKASRLFIFTLLVTANPIFATDISLFKISRDQSGLSIVFEKHLVARKGYDNQPQFNLQSNAVLYTRMADDQTTDIWSVSLTGEAKPLTNSKISEFSPTPINQSRFSAISAINGVQTLVEIEAGKVAAEYKGPIEPVGYHTWVSERLLAMFRLGEPNNLVLLDTHSNELKVLDQDIGRSLINLADGRSLLYSKNDGKGRKVLTLADTKADTKQEINQLSAKVEDFTWHKDFGIVHSDGSKFMQLNLNNKQWNKVNVDKPATINNISRMAISPDGQWLVAVHDDI
ncbi:MAG: hypothetical protein V2I33_08655 [Kangiellaceae bacterium]|jgi:hypothetical protein|nr:hypothetical protein [Kangiellaceae bacterium]